MEGEPARELIAAIRAEIELAADSILSAAETGLRHLQAAREGQAGALDRIEQILCALLEACAFQDLAGQRLTNLEARISTVGPAPAGDPLLNGPAAKGQGVSQAEADALMGGSSA
jgi:hypothetical protein